MLNIKDNFTKETFKDLYFLTSIASSINCINHDDEKLFDNNNRSIESFLDEYLCDFNRFKTISQNSEMERDEFWLRFTFFININNYSYYIRYFIAATQENNNFRNYFLISSGTNFSSELFYNPKYSNIVKRNFPRAYHSDSDKIRITYEKFVEDLITENTSTIFNLDCLL